jgi:hypothetical protein
MPGRDLTGRSAEDTTVSRWLGRYGVRLPVAVATAAVVLQAVLFLAVTVPHSLGVVARTVSVGTMIAPAVMWTVLGLCLGLFDGWQINEPRRMARLGRIAGHGLLGALVGAAVGGIAIVGGPVLVLGVALFVEQFVSHL